MIVVPGRAPRPLASEQRSSTFTGTVWLDPVLPTTGGSEIGVTVNNVFFTPGSRTFWHRHQHGQILHVTAGEGLICPAGETPHRIRAGDTIWVPAGERHWHGATPDSFLLHIAISLGSTEWADEVSPESYDCSSHE
jgi:quercetin dioxygenase-like cupin family protein